MNVLAGQFYISEDEVNKYLTSNVDPSGMGISYTCQICGKTAPNKSNMKKHMLVIHAKPANIPCPHCSKSFTNKYYLRYHIKCCNRNPELMAKKYQLVKHLWIKNVKSKQGNLFFVFFWRPSFWTIQIKFSCCCCSSDPKCLPLSRAFAGRK